MEEEERGLGREKERRPSCKWGGKEDEALRQVSGDSVRSGTETLVLGDRDERELVAY